MKGEFAMQSTPEEQLLARYALATALVPDPDEAHELFLRSRSEADLRRRCAAWLAQRGMAPPAGDPPLPVLNAEQQAHALALARLGRKRQRLLPLAGGGALVLVTLLGLLLALPDWRAASELVAAPAYRAAPVRALDRAGLHLAIYRAESNASTGQTMVWWELTGPQAGGGVDRVLAQLKVSGLQQDWLQPAHVTVAHPAGHRVLARTDYRVVAPLGDQLVVRLQRIGDHLLDWETNVPLVHTEQSALITH